ncbi:MAG: DUF5067 domain-containing protein [Oscillospiraceae bacterium]|nr:DUF5067 domain-containing protein [Oscillospiraceae bacterium]
MKKLFAIILAAAMLLTLAACGGDKPVETKPQESTPVQAGSETTPEVIADDELTHTFTQYGNARIKIVGSEFVKNDDEEDILRVYYEYTNTSTGDSARGHYPNTAVDFVSITQDGNDCPEYSFTPWDETYISEDGNDQMYVQPGRTMRNTMCFRCDPNGGSVKVSCYVMVGSWVYEPDSVEPFEFEIDPKNLMGVPAPFVLPPIPEPTYTVGMAASGAYGYYENEISINGVELTKDDEGVDVLRVKLTVTNNEEDSKSPALICDLELYQDGIGLPYPSTWDMAEPTAEDEAYETELEPGETVECNALYYLRNRNPVEAVIESSNVDTRLGARFDLNALYEAADAAAQAAADAASAAEAEARKALVGTWLQRDSDWDDTYIFNADGTGLLISGPEYPFTYSVSGDTLTITYDPEDVEEFTISVDGTLLTMINSWDEELLLDKQTEAVSDPEPDQPEATEPAEATEPTEPAEPTLQELVIGTWEDQETEYKETFTFNEDGTGKYGCEDNGHWEYTFTYAWYDGDYLEFTYDDDGSVGGFTVRIEGDVMYVSNAAVTDMPLVRK